MSENVQQDESGKKQKYENKNKNVSKTMKKQMRENTSSSAMAERDCSSSAISRKRG